MSADYQTRNRAINAPARLDRCPSVGNVPKRLLSALACCCVASVATQFACAQAPERDGKEVVEAVCSTCHRTGANGAPKIGDLRAWANIASRGLTSLTDVALKGIRKMPPHGGNSSLTDTEIARAITHMVNQSGGRWIEPISKNAPPAKRRGEDVVLAQCAKCHENGAGGAPKIGDRAAWLPRLRQGFDIVVRSAINGHGSMPSRGGVADTTDSEIRSAITYMINAGN